MRAEGGVGEVRLPPEEEEEEDDAHLGHLADEPHGLELAEEGRGQGVPYQELAEHGRLAEVPAHLPGDEAPEGHHEFLDRRRTRSGVSVLTRTRVHDILPRRVSWTRTAMATCCRAPACAPAPDISVAFVAAGSQRTVQSSR